MKKGNDSSSFRDIFYQNKRKSKTLHYLFYVTERSLPSIWLMINIYICIHIHTYRYICDMAALSDRKIQTLIKSQSFSFPVAL